MGTRSNTIVYEGEKIILNLYRQYDGYPSGHGHELAEFLSPIEIVNGLGEDKTKVANGMSCLAAQLVCHFKKEAGGFYIAAPVNDLSNDYTYEIREKAGTLQLTVYKELTLIFKGVISGPGNLSSFLNLKGN